ncbi:hypothetical protein Acsp01_30020 [Actinoplanes sp. NBRC 101535]|nr:hypothetical protein Acsp01_30020 [Actinoplanes sp. NBRC 101535]
MVWDVEYKPTIKASSPRSLGQKRESWNRRKRSEADQRATVSVAPSVFRPVVGFHTPGFAS